jgi:hypothetical protein
MRPATRKKVRSRQAAQVQLKPKLPALKTRPAALQLNKDTFSALVGELINTMIIFILALASAVCGSER